MNKRSYGIDILRILSMFGILGLHIINFGGAIDMKTNTDLFQYARLFISFFYCSVNIFSMISGYLYCERTHIKKNSIVRLLTITTFYCVVIFAFFYFLLPDTLTDTLTTAKALIIPLNNMYWYIVSYTFVFFLIPYINLLLNRLEQGTFKKLLLTVLFFLSFVSTFSLSDWFFVDYGYTPLWLIVCYCIGAYIKKYKTYKVPKLTYLGMILVNVIILYLPYIKYGEKLWKSFSPLND